MAELKWVIDVNEKLKNMVDASTEISQWKKSSIYKVPACITDLNKKAYRPQIVSFGPYHHGEAHLRPMEEHKQRALVHFLKRSGKPLESFVSSLEQVVEDLKKSYDPLDLKWQQDSRGFLQMMILDGSFMLEILSSSAHSYEDYAHNDPIFSSHGNINIAPYFKRDMLMLENQLPLLVIEKLVAVETNNTKDGDYVNKLIFKFFSTGIHVLDMGNHKCLHVLDVYRKSLLQERSHEKTQHHHRSWIADIDDHNIPTATQLYNAGIRFRKKKSFSLKNISFKHGVLKLPTVLIDDASEFIFLNLMAFERLHVGAGNEVTSYIIFMDNLIDNDRDVALLQSRGIIDNVMGSDKAVAKLFNSLSKDISLDPESDLIVVHKQVNKYWRQPWNAWKAHLMHTYFRNPWSLLSLIAAIFLFALTVVQTVYTVLWIIKPRN
ncbi:hypothetical protein Dsin_000838 [Dipteronia sinensis]|uniref:Uncharacterized protein n=1 Tax=Dipteronia sinensis TaxID=43782 RepID=A0AAE0B3Z4_9ROSI|nr:hypothetical protein Dsin_000838 [Dipteronia sinensis]